MGFLFWLLWALRLERFWWFGRGEDRYFSLSRQRKVTKRKRPLAGGLGAQPSLACWFHGEASGFDRTAGATGLLTCGVAGGIGFVVALHDGVGPGPSGCCRDQGEWARHGIDTGFVVGAVAPTRKCPPTPASRSTTPTTKTRGCYVVAVQTGNGRWPNQQCARHHRSDPETNATSRIVAARTGTGRMPAEPQTPRRNQKQ